MVVWRIFFSWIVATTILPIIIFSSTSPSFGLSTSTIWNDRDILQFVFSNASSSSPPVCQSISVLETSISLMWKIDLKLTEGMTKDNFDLCLIGQNNGKFVYNCRSFSFYPVILSYGRQENGNYSICLRNMGIHPLSGIAFLNRYSSMIDQRITVDSLSDSAPNATLCDPNFNIDGKCNLRSALHFCFAPANGNSSCTIILPTQETLSLNPAYGQLKFLNLHGDVSIIGNDCIISPSDQSRLRFIDISVNPTQFRCRFSVANVTIKGFSSEDGVGAIKLVGVVSSILNSVSFISNKGTFGGALYLELSSNIFIQNSVFTGNKALRSGGAINIYQRCTNITLNNLRIISNAVLAADSGGGGVFIHSQNSDLILEKLTIINNTATAGGGLHVFSTNDHMTVTNSIFYSNIASSSGGAIYLNTENEDINVVKTVFRQNAALIGGGLYSHEGNSNILLDGSSFEGNLAHDGGGGAIYLSLDTINTVISNTNFFNNTAVTSGGALFTIRSAKITLLNCKFMYNRAVNFGGAIYATDIDEIQVISSQLMFNQAYNGGGIFLQTSVRGNFLSSNFINNSASSVGGALSLGSFNTNMTWNSCNFTGNLAIDGGAMNFLDSNHDMNIWNSNFQHNQAENGGALYTISPQYHFNLQFCQFLYNLAGASGGAIFSSGFFHTTISNSQFLSNRAQSGNGGALYIETSSEVEIRLCSFVKNIAANGGGSIALEKSNKEVLIISSQFQSDEAFSGGSLYCSTRNNVIIVRDCRFNGSSAYMGAAIFVHEDNDEIALEDSSFTTLQSVSVGGILFNKDNRNITLRNCIFTSNIAVDGASALLIYSENEAISIINTQFYWNLALQGSGIVTFFEKNYDITFINCTFSQNMAQDGGIVVLNFQNYRLRIINSEFRNNHGRNGAIYINYRNENILLENSIFVHNFMTLGGGGVYFDTENEYLILRNCTFQLNIVLESGGGVYVKDNNMLVQLLSCTFLSNRAHIYGGALALRTGNSIILLRECNIHNNTAFSSGGGIHSALYNDMTVQFSYFLDNGAYNYGGAVYYGEDHQGISIFQTTFRFNIASRGGGIYISRSNQDIEIRETLFDENEAVESGGGIYLLSDFVNFFKTQFFRNFAPITGGGISLIAIGTKFNNCWWYNNSATSGGAAFIQASNLITFTSCEFLSNAANFGAGMGIISVTDIHMMNCSFSHHIASQGTLFVEDSLNVTIQRSVFSKNFAQIDGGAIYSRKMVSLLSSFTRYDSNSATMNGGAFYVIQSSRLEVIASSFQNNSAGTGSGSAIWMSETPSILMNNSFTLNAAPAGAGCIFWEYMHDANAPVGLNSVENNFTSNTALYGPNYATNGMLLYPFNGPRYNITTYVAYLPTIQIQFLDYYNQTVLTASDLIASISVMPEYSQPSACFDGAGYVSGGIYETLHAGIINFSTLQAHCAPGYHFGLLISLEFTLSSSSQSIALSQQLELYFRDCLRGEYYSSKICIQCQNGTYSLAKNQYLDITSCTRCPEHAVDCYADKIYTKAGYWRVNDDAITLQPCPYGENSCHGGWGTGLDLCAMGYEGPLCAICSPNYFKSSLSSCKKCTNASLITDPMVLVIIILVAFLLSLLIVICIAFPAFQFRNFGNSLIRMKSFLIHFMMGKRAITAVKDPTDLYVSQLLTRFQGRLKIYLVTYQIIAAFPFVLDLNYPNSVSGLFASFDILNLSASHTTSLSCSFPSLDYVDYLLIETILPILILCLIFFIYCVHCIYSRSNHPSSSPYLAISICFLYLIFPGVSTTIFRTFSCQDVDPDDVTDENDLYLRSDYSISCHSSRYTFGLIWAIMMIFVYPLGVPLIFFLFLYYRRTRMITSHLSVSEISVFSESKKMNKGSELSLKFLPDRLLYANYRPDCWYWEIIECYYRIMFSGLLVLIQQGSSLQIIVGLLILLMFFKLYSIFQPYRDPLLATLKEISFWQLYSLLFLSLLLKVDVVFVNQQGLVACFFISVLGNLCLEILRLGILGTTGYDIYLFEMTKGLNLASSTSPRLPDAPAEVCNPFQENVTGIHSQTISRSISSQRSISSFEMESRYGTDVQRI